MSKAVIFFAPGLEECEGLLCVDLLRRSGVEVTIAAVGGEKIVKSARSISVVVDAPQDIISALSGKLGCLPDVSAKAVYAKQA